MTHPERQMAGPEGRRILVTGGTGFIGSALCNQLVRQGNEVHLAVRPGRGNTVDGARHHVVNLTDPTDVEGLVDRFRPEIVFHLVSSAFNPPGLTASDHLEANVTATLVLLEALKTRPDTVFVQTGSIAEFRPGSDGGADERLEPINLYGAMKACAGVLVETYARMYGLKAVRAILFTAYGPGEADHRLVPSTIRAALDNREIRIRDGAVERDLVFIDDVVDALCRMAITDLPPGASLALCSGTGTSVRHVVEEILHLMQADIAIREEPTSTRPDEIRTMRGDNRAARDLLGWEPRHSLRAGLEKSIAWCRDQAPIKETAP